MSKLDVFLWHTIVIVKFPEAATRVALYEHLFYRTPSGDCFWVSTKRYWQTYRMLDKRKYKKDSYTEKKAKHGTEGNELKCKLLKA